MNALMKVVMPVVVLFVCFVLFDFSVCLKKEVRTAIDNAECRLRGAMQDPESLQIDDVTVYRAYDDVLHVCGTLRARNGFGGVIRKHFVVAPGFPTPVFVGDNSFSEVFNACSGQVLYIKS